MIKTLIALCGIGILTLAWPASAANCGVSGAIPSPRCETEGDRTQGVTVPAPKPEPEEGEEGGSAASKAGHAGNEGGRSSRGYDGGAD